MRIPPIGSPNSLPASEEVSEPDQETAMGSGGAGMFQD